MAEPELQGVELKSDNVIGPTAGRGLAEPYEAARSRRPESVMHEQIDAWRPGTWTCGPAPIPCFRPCRAGATVRGMRVVTPVVSVALIALAAAAGATVKRGAASAREHKPRPSSCRSNVQTSAAPGGRHSYRAASRSDHCVGELADARNYGRVRPGCATACAIRIDALWLGVEQGSNRCGC